MSYTPAIDFLALLRSTGGGVRTERMPGLDYVVAALARAGLLQLVVGQVAPTADQANTAWFKPGVPSWAGEGTLFLWNAATAEYEVATIALWRALLGGGSAGPTVVQNITVAGPTAVQVNAGIVLVQNVGVAVALTMPPAATMDGPVLISDWANGATANNITITTTGGELFPGGFTTWKIAVDAGSVFLRPVPGGFAL